MNVTRDEQRITELSLLAYCIRDGQPRLASDVFAVCGPETFVHNDTRAVAEAVRALAERQEEIDLAGIAKTMKDAGALARAGGAGFLAEILQVYRDTILTESRLFEAAHELAGEHRKREAIRELSASLRDIQAVGTDTGVIAGNLREIASMLDGEGKALGGSTFKVLSSDDLMALPRPMWRVKGLFPQCGTVVVHGVSRSGKTFTVLDLVLATALEKEWFGWKTSRCDIVYTCLESVWGLQGRLKAWTLDRQRDLPENVRFIIEPFDLRNPKHVRDMCQLAPKNGILVIDTLNRAAPGADENSSKDMSIIINAANEIQTAMQGLVLLVAHSGKDTSKGIRGHSSLFAALDANIEVGRNGDTRFIKVDKVKEAEDGAKKFFRLKPVVIGTDEDGEDITSCVVEPVDEGAAKVETKPLTKSQEYAVETLVKALRQERTTTVKLETWRERFYAEHWADSTDAKRMAFQRARQDLIEKQRVFVINDSYGVTDRTNA